MEDQMSSPRKKRKSISTARQNIQNISYDNKLFDNVDNRIRSYLQKNQINYEKTLVKLYNLDKLKSEKAQRLVLELNQTRRPQFSGVRPVRNIERNNSVPASKQLQLDLKALQEIKKIKPEIQTLNVSMFKFSQTNETRLENPDWERVDLQVNKIRPKMTNFEQEIDRLNHYYNRNETSLNQLIQVQKELMNYQLNLK
ncbi:hypothetical protein pb186bvf_009043 [Paramecium bursaria]